MNAPRKVAEISTLLDAPEGSPAADRLEVLSTLVESYEESHHPIEPSDPVEAIKFYMEHMGLTRKDLEPLIGGRGREIIGDSIWIFAAYGGVKRVQQARMAFQRSNLFAGTSKHVAVRDQLGRTLPGD